ncbi:MAG: 1-deoxy-D-xylulose-5-phosphate synthase [Nitrospirae bacterium]|nr:1-deoxy-D-xylulose-5-phosphate synthase [Nitrospirota bacterium]
MNLLGQILSPSDLRKLSPEQLPLVAEEIRERIIQVVSQNGGHLGAGLGAVEITLALHYLFNTPEDRIVWDVGHQAYPHKLLTGRNGLFPTLRQYQGLSGFPKRDESPYDTFGAGHAGTAISAALGMVEARDQKGLKHKVIAVVGDGALTSGIALEGLNHAGALRKDMLVILNDNEMSISKNVGAISAYLNRLMTGKMYTALKKETEHILKNIPKIGEPMVKFAKMAEEGVKGLIGPGIIFEELGFHYVGPIDGHRLDHVLLTLENIKQLSGPFLVHFITKKGKGYPPAEKDQAAFHGTSAFHIETGEPKKKSLTPTYTKVFAETLTQLAREDSRIVAITAAMPEGTGLHRFQKEHPGRFYDTGIAEQHAVTFAGGLATEGMKPVVAIYSTFLQRGYDQIIHDIAIQNLPVLFCLDRAGLVGEDGATHHGVFDLSYLSSVPQMVVMAPRDENELRRMMKTGLMWEGPAALRYPRGEVAGVKIDDEILSIPVGKGEALKEGVDAYIIATGSTVQEAIGAREEMTKRGISAGVFDARFVKPLDRPAILEIAGKTPFLVTIEENVLAGGFGSKVLELLQDEGRMARVLRLGVPDYFIEQGAQKLLRESLGLNARSIAASIEKFLGKKNLCEVKLSEKPAIETGVQTANLPGVTDPGK